MRYKNNDCNHPTTSQGGHPRRSEIFVTLADFLSILNFDLEQQTEHLEDIEPSAIAKSGRRAYIIAGNLTKIEQTKKMINIAGNLLRLSRLGAGLPSADVETIRRSLAGRLNNRFVRYILDLPGYSATVTVDPQTSEDVFACRINYHHFCEGEY